MSLMLGACCCGSGCSNACDECSPALPGSVIVTLPEFDYVKDYYFCSLYYEDWLSVWTSIFNYKVTLDFCECDPTAAEGAPIVTYFGKRLLGTSTIHETGEVSCFVPNCTYDGTTWNIWIVLKLQFFCGVDSGYWQLTGAFLTTCDDGSTDFSGCGGSGTPTNPCDSANGVIVGVGGGGFLTLNDDPTTYDCTSTIPDNYPFGSPSINETLAGKHTPCNPNGFYSGGACIGEACSTETSGSGGSGSGPGAAPIGFGMELL